MPLLPVAAAAFALVALALIVLVARGNDFTRGLAPRRRGRSAPGGTAGEPAAPARPPPAFAARLRGATAPRVLAVLAAAAALTLAGAALARSREPAPVTIEPRTAPPAAASAPGTPAPAVAATATAAPVTATTAPPAVTPTAASAPALTPPLAAGSPFSASALLDALAARGLRATALDERVTCAGSAVTPRVYRVARASGGGEQRAVLLVYDSPTALSAEWTAARGGAPAFRQGACVPGAAGFYWNHNLVLAFPPATDDALRRQTADAFLALTP